MYLFFDDHKTPKGCLSRVHIKTLKRDEMPTKLKYADIEQTVSIDTRKCRPIQANNLADAENAILARRLKDLKINSFDLEDEQCLNAWEYDPYYAAFNQGYYHNCAGGWSFEDTEYEDEEWEDNVLNSTRSIVQRANLMTEMGHKTDYIIKLAAVRLIMLNGYAEKAEKHKNALRLMLPFYEKEWQKAVLNSERGELIHSLELDICKLFKK